MDYFGGEGRVENINTLKRILGTLALYDPQLGIMEYVQCEQYFLVPKALMQ